MTFQQRKSNIELLRIVAMAMIVVYHVIIHGITPTGILPKQFRQCLCIPVIQFSYKGLNGV